MTLLHRVYKPRSELYERINYTRTILLTGLLKSTLETALISMGVTVCTFSIITTEYNDKGLLVGLLLLALGIIVDYIGDKTKMQKKDEELKHTEDYCKEKAKEVAENLVKEELNNIGES